MHRLALIVHDHADLSRVNIHHWQEHNPIICEALVQLTLGAPQIIYNGGLLHCRVRYFDAERQRPGLPADVAALVETLTDQNTVIKLVNLSPFAEHTVILQAGGFGEHRFAGVTYDRCTSEYPGSHKNYAPSPIDVCTEQMQSSSTTGDRYLQVTLPPGTQITLDLITTPYIGQPDYTLPW
jgi:hypothetical protein